MNSKMHGKQIDAIYFEGGVGGYSGNPECVRARGGLKIHLSITFHGDHDQIWIVETLNGQETRRHNARHVSSIDWSPPSESVQGES